MHLNKHLSSKIQLTFATLAILHLSSILLAEATTEAQEDEQNKKLVSQKDLHDYQVPFLVLMSSSEVCVVQLPLIANGNINVVYRLQDYGKEVESEENEVSSNNSDSTSSSRRETITEAGAQKTSTANTDTREYEQMPKSTSLGKSEWQQIGSSRKFSSADDREEEASPERRGASGGQEEGTKKEINRPRRNNNLTGAEGSLRDSNNSNSISSESNNEPANGNAVLDSSTRTLNVTSARFSNEDEAASSTSSPASLGEEAEEDGNDTIGSAGNAATTNGAGDYDEEAGDAAIEKEKSGNSIQFRDLDVHMALGYAFVADSRGQIHRFKLSGLQKDDPSKVSSENGYANTIDAASGFRANEFSSKQSNRLASTYDSKFQHTESNSSRESDISVADDGGYFGDSSLAPDDDANKVDAATHEQSGRHPTASGLEKLLQPTASTTEAHSAESSIGGNTPTSAGKSSSSLVSIMALCLRVAKFAAWFKFRTELLKAH